MLATNSSAFVPPAEVASGLVQSEACLILVSLVHLPSEAWLWKEGSCKRSPPKAFDVRMPPLVCGFPALGTAPLAGIFAPKVDNNMQQ